MRVVLVRVRHRAGRRLYRVHAEVDGRRVGFRSEAARGWSCSACSLSSHATCSHVTAVKDALSGQGGAGTPTPSSLAAGGIGARPGSDSGHLGGPVFDDVDAGRAAAS